MCGILGTNFLSLKFKNSLEMLNNRGPDYKNSFKVNNCEFGHTRLSIIDLDNEANQPMVFDNIILVFNGEIYNFKEIIIEEKLICKTKSDSEIIIRLYLKYGENFLNKLNGMFSFCIYDIQKKFFFCARDRYGKKPFFYYYLDNKFIFSSSIKSIVNLLDKKPELNKIALSKYMQYFVSYGKDTFYKNINKLDAGSYLKYDGNKILEKKYYKIKTYKKVNSEYEAIENIEKLLLKSVEYRMISDAPMATLLSGGIDSSLISSIYSSISNKKIDTFSIGYKEHKKYSELPYASIVAKHINSNHHEIEITKTDYMEYFNNTLEALEEPHADSAAIPLNILTKKINSYGIKSVLSGEGSDEIFLGYDNYFKFLKYYKFKNSLSEEQFNFLDGIVIALQNNTKESEYLRRIIKKENLYNGFGEVYNYSQKKRLFNKVPLIKSEKVKKDPVDWMSYIDLKIWLGEVLLSKVDRISMNNSVEVRTPFLDYNLVDYMFSIKSEIKIGNTNKYLLKKIANKYIPKEIISRTKKGFNSPFNEWLNEEYGIKILEVILYVNKNTMLFNEEYIKYIYNLAKNNKFKQHLYSLFVFSIWYKKEYL